MQNLWLNASIVKPEHAELFTIAVPHVKRQSEHRRWYGDGFNTPGGLPLEFWIEMWRDVGELIIATAGTNLLGLGNVSANCDLHMLLPTDEVLYVRVTTRNPPDTNLKDSD